MSAPTQEREQAPEVAAALDMLLTDAAVGVGRRFRPVRSTAALGWRLASNPASVVKLGTELVRIAAGISEIEPDKGDRRFKDRAWSENPVMRRIVQTYLASAGVVTELLDSGENDDKVEFAATNLVDLLAPSNMGVLNPAVWKEIIDTGGANTLRGLRAFVEDMSTRPRVPRMVEPDAFEVGEDLAVTPGVVVSRTPLYELIQYGAQTDSVHATPLLIVPPSINKYYILDLAPGRSLVEFLVSEGFQVFMMSWRNPDERFRNKGLDAYGEAVVEALDTVRTVADSPTANLMGVCSGGIVASMVMAHLAETGDTKVDAFSLLVTVLDQGREGLVGNLIDEPTARAAMAASGKKGYLDGNALAEVFAWLRPNDLIWNYWVNNYLLGRKPAAFDILFWNADTTRMAAQLHHDFLTVAMDNQLVTADAATMMGTPVDLGKITTDNYVVAGVADHLCAWQSCYQSTQLIGGKSRFVLSTSGHIAALVNPPGNPRANFETEGELVEGATDWRGDSSKRDGSWWPDYSSWLGKRSGPRQPPPEQLGRAEFEAMEPAPGTYVFD